MNTKRFINFVVIGIVVLFIISLIFVDGLKPDVSRELLSSEPKDISEIGVVTKEELATLPIEKTLSYEEMKNHIMEDKDYSSEQIHYFDLNHDNDNIEESNYIIRYTILRLDGWSHRGSVNGSKVNYSVIPELLVGLEYYKNSSTPNRIVTIEAPTFDSSDGDDCSFYGLFDYKLVSGNEIFTALRGYLYDGGNIDWEHVEDRIDVVKLNLSGSYRGEGMYVSYQETYYDSDMEP